MKEMLFKLLFAAEYAELQRRRAADPRPARFRLEGGLPEAAVTHRLAGTEKLPAIEAVMALLDAAIVRQTDRASEPPREAYTGPRGEYVPAFTAEMRTYEAGGADALAAYKQRLQELTAPRESEPEAATESR